MIEILMAVAALCSLHGDSAAYATDAHQRDCQAELLHCLDATPKDPLTRPDRLAVCVIKRGIDAGWKPK